MKRLILIFFVVGTVLVFFSCSKDNATAPEMSNIPELNQAPELSQAPEISQFDQLPEPSLNECGTYFSGTSTFQKPVEPGTTTLLPNGKTLIKGEVAEWYDDATDPRVTGVSFWTVNKLLNPDGTGRAWGKAEIIVNNSGGKWKIIWWGKITEVGVDAKAIGVGVEGTVRGLFARWTYTMVFANIVTVPFYTSEGKIIGH